MPNCKYISPRCRQRISGGLSIEKLTKKKQLEEQLIREKNIIRRVLLGLSKDPKTIKGFSDYIMENYSSLQGHTKMSNIIKNCSSNFKINESQCKNAINEVVKNLLSNPNITTNTRNILNENNPKKRAEKRRKKGGYNFYNNPNSNRNQYRSPLRYKKNKVSRDSWFSWLFGGV